MDASCLKVEFDIKGGRLYCQVQGDTHFEASKRALVDIASVQMRYRLPELVLIDQTRQLNDDQITRSEQFELALYFSEWFRGVSVAFVRGVAAFDWSLIGDACRANGLELEIFDDLDSAETWLFSLQSKPPQAGGQTWVEDRSGLKPD